MIKLNMISTIRIFSKILIDKIAQMLRIDINNGYIQQRQQRS